MRQQSKKEETHNTKEEQEENKHRTSVLRVLALRFKTPAHHSANKTGHLSGTRCDGR
jgi:hypothetical protein